jgi:paraquat-inducible protein B
MRKCSESNSDDDDDIDVDRVFDNRKVKNKRSATKISDACDASSVMNNKKPAISSSSKSSAPQSVVDLESEDIDDVQAQIRAQLEKLEQQNNKSNLNQSIDSLSPTIDGKKVNDAVDKSLLDIKKRIETSRQRITNASQATDSNIFDLTSSSAVYIPKVKSAQEREKEAAKLLEEKTKTLTTTQTKNAKSSATTSASSLQLGFSDDDENGNNVLLKVRLGSHQKEWSLPMDCPFSKVSAT